MLNNKFLGAIARIILDTDIKPVWVSSVEDAAAIITGVSKIKPITRETIRPQVFKRLSTDDLRLDMLTSIKGVSIKKGKRPNQRVWLYYGNRRMLGISNPSNRRNWRYLSQKNNFHP